MMKTLKIEFDEQAKAVTANVKIEYTGEECSENEEEQNETNDSILEETKRLFDKAMEYSHLKTLQKLR